MKMLNLGGNYSIFDIKVCSYDIIGWKHTRAGGVKIGDTLYFFMDIMFELPLCHYYEGFSQLFCILW
jgi:hypothetical protein